MLGEQGSAKTSTILNSGLEPELLAGVAHQDNTVAPTRTANFWLARNAIFAEAGANLLSEQSRWVRLVRRLSPASLKSVVGGNVQAPRAAVSVSMRKLYPTGSRGTAWSRLRNTKSDWERSSRPSESAFPSTCSSPAVIVCLSSPITFARLTNEEAGQVLGVTLPMRNVQAGVYAEEETRRLVGAFDSLFYSLADKRLHFLPRESDPQRFRAPTNSLESSARSAMRLSSFWSMLPAQPVTHQSVSSRFLFQRCTASGRAGHATPGGSIRSVAERPRPAGHATGMFAAMRPGAAAQSVPQPHTSAPSAFLNGCSSAAYSIR